GRFFQLLVRVIADAEIHTPSLHDALPISMDTHLPDRRAIEVELADALIRIGDLAGMLDLDLASAVIEKMEYNAIRADHKLSVRRDRKSTRLNSSHVKISYAVFCLKKKSQ